MGADRVTHHRRSFDAVPFAASAARSFVATTLRDDGAPAHAVEDFKLAISELVSNIVEHGAGRGFDVCIDLARPDLWVVGIECAATDAGPTLPDPAAWTLAGPDELSGRGLGIVRALMDDVAVHTAGGRLTINCSIQR